MIGQLRKGWLDLNVTKIEVMQLGTYWVCSFYSGWCPNYSTEFCEGFENLAGYLLWATRCPQWQSRLFFCLQQACPLAPYLSRSAFTTVIHVTVISGLDYSSLFDSGLPLKLLQKLQLVQNAAARLLTDSPWFAHPSHFGSCTGILLVSRSNSRCWC